MKVTIGMRTANRRPKPNYLRKTLLDLRRSGLDLTALHLAVGNSNTAWLTTELDALPDPHVITPDRALSANANGLLALESALDDQAEMVLLLEDDLAFCADFPGSVSRWLDRHATRDRHVYRLFGFTKPPSKKAEAYDWPLDGLRASQAIVLWQDEAENFLSWGLQHLTDWCPLAPWGRRAPHNTDPGIAFDKFLATWALLRWPKVPGVISQPYFVKHIGDQSTLHSYGARNDAPFAGSSWSYQVASA